MFIFPGSPLPYPPIPKSIPAYTVFSSVLILTSPLSASSEHYVYKEYRVKWFVKLESCGRWLVSFKKVLFFYKSLIKLILGNKQQKVPPKSGIHKNVSFKIFCIWTFQGYQLLTLFLVIFRNFPTAVNLHTILHIFVPTYNSIYQLTAFLLFKNWNHNMEWLLKLKALE
jgi:hypothetical protein